MLQHRAHCVRGRTGAPVMAHQQPAREALLDPLPFRCKPRRARYLAVAEEGVAEKEGAQHVGFETAPPHHRVACIICY